MHSVKGIPAKVASNGAARQRLHAQRKANGLVVLPLLCPEVDMTEMLLDLGFLANPDPSRQELSEAASRWAYAVLTRHVSTRWPDG